MVWLQVCAQRIAVRGLPERKIKELFFLCQGAKEIIFTTCHSGKLKLAFTSPDVIKTSLKNYSTSRIDFTVLLLFEFLKRPLARHEKLKTEFTSPMAKSISHGLSDTPLFARCLWSSIAKERQVGSETGTLLGLKGGSEGQTRKQRGMIPTVQFAWNAYV